MVKASLTSLPSTVPMLQNTTTTSSHNQILCRPNQRTPTLFPSKKGHTWDWANELTWDLGRELRWRKEPDSDLAELLPWVTTEYYCNNIYCLYYKYSQPDIHALSIVISSRRSPLPLLLITLLYFVYYSSVKANKWVLLREIAFLQLIISNLIVC